MPNGSEHLVVREGSRSLQLAINGASLHNPVSLHTNVLVEGRYLHQRLSALQALNAVVSDQRFPVSLFPPDPRSRRLRHVLQALDGALAGATYRQIGVALFGEQRVEADWSDPRHHLLDRVRRAVRRGRSLMKVRYRSFLL